MCWMPRTRKRRKALHADRVRPASNEGSSSWAARCESSSGPKSMREKWVCPGGKDSRNPTRTESSSTAIGQTHRARSVSPSSPSGSAVAPGCNAQGFPDAFSANDSSARRINAGSGGCRGSSRRICVRRSARENRRTPPTSRPRTVSSLNETVDWWASAAAGSSSARRSARISARWAGCPRAGDRSRHRGRGPATSGSAGSLLGSRIRHRASGASAPEGTRWDRRSGRWASRHRSGNAHRPDHGRRGSSSRCRWHRRDARRCATAPSPRGSASKASAWSAGQPPSGEAPACSRAAALPNTAPTTTASVGGATRTSSSALRSTWLRAWTAGSANGRSMQAAQRRNRARARTGPRIVPEPMVFRQAVDPLGSFDRAVKPAIGLVLGVLAVLAATALLELSRTLAETYRGRWFAGNGRDVFHAAAALVLTTALLANGLPPALAALVAAALLTLPLLFLDSLSARRPRRVAMLFALVGIGALPPLLEPRSIVDAANALARLLFY